MVACHAMLLTGEVVEVALHDGVFPTDHDSPGKFVILGMMYVDHARSVLSISGMHTRGRCSCVCTCRQSAPSNFPAIIALILDCLSKIVCF